MSFAIITPAFDIFVYEPKNAKQNIQRDFKYIDMNIMKNEIERKGKHYFILYDGVVPISIDDNKFSFLMNCAQKYNKNFCQNQFQQLYKLKEKDTQVQTFRLRQKGYKI